MRNIRRQRAHVTSDSLSATIGFHDPLGLLLMAPQSESPATARAWTL
jgi:hypothetical protein